MMGYEDLLLILLVDVIPKKEVTAVSGGITPKRPCGAVGHTYPPQWHRPPFDFLDVARGDEVRTTNAWRASG